MIKKSIFIIFLTVIGLTACHQNNTPKPRGFIRVNYPERQYVKFESNAPFTFKYPSYATVDHDSSRNSEEFWYNVEYHQLNATLHLTYKPINNQLGKLIEDSYSLAYKHSVKADGIDEVPINIAQNKVYGIEYDIKGSAASSLQFFLTDSSRHFIRGSLYFNSVVRKDSLAPILTFIKTDIDTLINTLEWKK
jgi:gliding motility-associated lipoprotein GldD